MEPNRDLLRKRETLELKSTAAKAERCLLQLNAAMKAKTVRFSAGVDTAEGRLNTEDITIFVGRQTEEGETAWEVLLKKQISEQEQYIQDIYFELTQRIYGGLVASQRRDAGVLKEQWEKSHGKCYEI